MVHNLCTRNEGMEDTDVIKFVMPKIATIYLPHGCTWNVKQYLQQVHKPHIMVGSFIASVCMINSYITRMPCSFTCNAAQDESQLNVIMEHVAPKQRQLHFIYSRFQGLVVSMGLSTIIQYSKVLEFNIPQWESCQKPQVGKDGMQ